MADNSKFGIAEAQIVGLFMESVSYGTSENLSLADFISYVLPT